MNSPIDFNQIPHLGRQAEQIDPFYTSEKVCILPVGVQCQAWRQGQDHQTQQGRTDRCGCSRNKLAGYKVQRN